MNATAHRAQKIHLLICSQQGPKLAFSMSEGPAALAQYVPSVCVLPGRDSTYSCVTSVLNHRPHVGSNYPRAAQKAPPRKNSSRRNGIRHRFSTQPARPMTRFCLTDGVRRCHTPPARPYPPLGSCTEQSKGRHAPGKKILPSPAYRPTVALVRPRDAGRMCRPASSAYPTDRAKRSAAPIVGRPLVLLLVPVLFSRRPSM